MEPEIIFRFASYTAGKRFFESDGFLVHETIGPWSYVYPKGTDPLVVDDVGGPYALGLLYRKSEHVGGFEFFDGDTSSELGAEREYILRLFDDAKLLGLDADRTSVVPIRD
jgi:hypothetical protein